MTTYITPFSAYQHKNTKLHGYILGGKCELIAQNQALERADKGKFSLAADATSASSKPDASTSLRRPSALTHALHMPTTLAGVLDQIEVFVVADLLDADEHPAAPCRRSRARHHDIGDSVKAKRRRRSDHLAPQIGLMLEKHWFYWPFGPPQCANYGSWARGCCAAV